MSTPLQRDGAPEIRAQAGVQTNVDARPSRSQDRSVADGFADAAQAFRFDDAELFRKPPKSVASTPLEADRQKVEGLLKDAGVAPPPVGLSAQTSAPVQIDWVRPGPNVLPRHGAARLAKRALDVGLSLIALSVLAPLLALIALALRAEGGPVFYCQSRVGRGRRRFTCVKFRTMRVDADDRLRLLLACNDAARAEWSKHQKLIDDPRVTPLGRILRESSLDELPQLINVLRGEMSLVGPRPIIAPEIAGFDADRAYFGSAAFEDYAACLPGITGLWQISGRHQTIYLERVRLDRQYARTWSFGLDLMIIWKTVGVVLRRSGR